MTTKKTLTNPRYPAIAAITLGILTTLSTSVRAQNTDAPKTPERSGFTLGASLGAGGILVDCDGCNADYGFAFDVSLGYLLNSTNAILYDVSAVSLSDNGLTGISVINALAWQRWETDSIWTKGGIGVGRFIVADDDTAVSTDFVFALTAAVGYEFYQSEHSAFDIQLRLGDTMFDDFTLYNASLMVGANWY